jgi:hypothetical protein
MAEIQAVLNKLEEAARASHPAVWVAIVILFSTVASQHIVRANAEWLRYPNKIVIEVPHGGPGHEELRTVIAVDIPPDVWRWLRQQAPFRPDAVALSEKKSSALRNSATALLKETGLPAWQEEPLRPLRHLGMKRLLSLADQNDAKVLEGTGRKSSEYLTHFFGPTRFRGEALKCFEVFARHLPNHP